MRSVTRCASCAGASARVAFGAARADNNDFMGQAQKFFNNGKLIATPTSTGRDDELRRQQAERDRRSFAAIATAT